MTAITFRPKGNLDGTTVLVDGVEVGWYRKRVESYTGIQRGGRYTYFDFYPAGEKWMGRDSRIGCASTRKAALAEGLVALEMYEAAKVADFDMARHYAEKKGVKL